MGTGDASTSSGAGHAPSHAIHIGSSFTHTRSPSSAAFYALRYLQQPASLDLEGRTSNISAHPTLRDSVLVTYPAVSSKGKGKGTASADNAGREVPEARFAGQSLPAKEVDCVLLWDEERQSYSLERLDSQLRLSYERSTPSRAAAPTTAAAPQPTSTVSLVEEPSSSDDEVVMRPPVLPAAHLRKKATERGRLAVSKATHGGDDDVEDFGDVSLGPAPNGMGTGPTASIVSNGDDDEDVDMEGDEMDFGPTPKMGRSRSGMSMSGASVESERTNVAVHAAHQVPVQVAPPPAVPNPVSRPTPAPTTNTVASKRPRPASRKSPSKTPAPPAPTPSTSSSTLKKRRRSSVATKGIPIPYLPPPVAGPSTTRAPPMGTGGKGRGGKGRGSMPVGGGGKGRTGMGMGGKGRGGKGRAGKKVPGRGGMEGSSGSGSASASVSGSESGESGSESGSEDEDDGVQEGYFVNPGSVLSRSAQANTQRYDDEDEDEDEDGSDDMEMLASSIEGGFGGARRRSTSGKGVFVSKGLPAAARDRKRDQNPMSFSRMLGSDYDEQRQRERDDDVPDSSEED